MSKFGEIIDLQVPILLNFYTEWDENCKHVHPILKDVVFAMGDKAKVIKINVDKNQELAEALRIKTLPTFVIYKSGEMVWRKSGFMEANDLLSTLKNDKLD
ncbi:co-chaperone YbbN [Flavobacterium sp. CS20]|uniref:thioredoxin family protein n=1 Tax=Flavobacterium sp. CS20 TaxID=2775246 RepID=UPI001B39D578|nr:thioredoxin family protein [Flavobacterium sp. CS20]QTY26849.1 thioredoxin family protein [Flavobacterium sp. CS20]